MNEIRYPFNPQMGSEKAVLSQDPKTGFIYFTTDTRKIYLDIDENKSKIPMGGNIGLFYGKMKPSGFVADDQEEFEFTIEDIVRDEETNLILAPNVNDLILNDDGCFYKVLSVNENIFNTKKLTIAGTGGNTTSKPDSLSSFDVGRVSFSTTNVLQGGSCVLSFVVKVTDDIGDYVTDNIGYYEIWINGIPKIKNIPLKGISKGETSDSLSNFNPDEINTIDIASYLPLTQKIPIGLKCYDTDGNEKISRTLSSVSVSSMELEWNYDNKTINHWNSEKDSMTLSWTVSGANLKKNTYITIDNDNYPYLIGSGNQDSYIKELKFNEYNLTHGTHTIKLWAEADLGEGEVIPTPPIYKNIMVAEEGNTNTIISICLFEKELTQYNTIAIPIYIYNDSNIAGTYAVTLMEDSIIKTQWENVPNLGADETKSIWYYTPLYASDAITLAVSAGGSSESITVAVKGLGVSLDEKAGYALKFKANEFSSNTDIQSWSAQNGKYKAHFSSNFDWINGGIGSEKDDSNGDRQFVLVKAGTYMDIDYPLWGINAPGNGKHLKVIFKATNCRDYDAHVLSCKIDKKIVFVNTTEEFFILTDAVTTLEYADSIKINSNEQLELINIKTGVLNALDKVSALEFKNKYICFENEFYQCAVIIPNPNEPDNFYVTWYKTEIRDSFNGIELKAQNAAVKTNNTSISTQYCEDSYIEFEAEFTAASSGKSYIKLWLDGVPCGYTIYDVDSDLFQLTTPTIRIGSTDCDVQIYLIKIYETELSIKDHMQNFYADAPNAQEMLNRYNRNNIMNASNELEIDMFELAKKNPDCLVHHYVVPQMPTTKKTKIGPCEYYQYQGSSSNKYRAEGVMIKVQGTSSEKYVVSAANLDTDFDYHEGDYVPSGILDSTGKKLEGWSMSENAIPINFACTKVNVASCENVNNYINQEWYNKFQPYQSVLRCKKPNARDTMQFTPGVIFITDNNTTIDKPTGVGDNVFKDTPGYVGNAYAKMYSLGQMGNSKDNIEVLHDTSNPLECCIEVADNQRPQQCMIDDEYTKDDIGAGSKIFEFRYPKDNINQTMIDAWNEFVSWMAHVNPSPKYEKHENITSEKKYKDFAVNKKTFENIPTYIMNSDETDFEESSYNPEITTYYTLTDHKYGYTGLKLPEAKTYGIKKFVGYRAENEKRPDQTLWQKDYNPMIAGCEVKAYAGTYTHDTYEYRMAKMLDECEDHLVMDSVLYHYLFIERHCMNDNVAKNTFWSTEDCQHWNMIKDYDNDTADGNDNQGKLTRTYGMEPTDRFNSNETVFNASRSVWFNFCHGLYEALEWMYEKLANRKLTLNDGSRADVWDYQAYLKLANKIQSSIPERCWIEDYQRKYFRPNEVYHDTMYNDMLEGGQKKHQRKQFETYQNIYLNSKYEMVDDDRFVFRPTGDDLLNAEIPIEVYSDCYIYSNTGSAIKKRRVKRNTPASISPPVANLQNSTMYIHPGSNITKMGTMEKPLGVFAPTQMSFAQGKKLREIIYGHEDQFLENTGLEGIISFEGATQLEKAYLSGINQSSSENTSLNLKSCTSLIELDTTNSTFTGITLPNNAPTISVKLDSPTALTASNLTKLKEFNIKNFNKLRSIKLENMDQSSIPNLSKNVIAKAMEHVSGGNEADIIQYKITKAKWSLTDSDEIEGINIPLLDKMLNIDYSKPFMSDDNIENLSYAASLTGNINIATTAYDEERSLDIYNKYITDTKFANLDMEFESQNAKLYNITIYDGDGLAFWNKKTIPNTELNEDFLSSGPKGSFDIEKLYKSPTAEFNYEFLNSWIVKNDKGEIIQELEGTLPIGLVVNQNLHIYSNFKETKRSYRIMIKFKHPQTKEITILQNKEFEYGTPFKDIVLKDNIPYVDSSNLPLEHVYDFIGYSLREDSTTPVSNNYAVRGEDTLWTIFKLEENVRKVVHQEWFKAELHSYNEPRDTKFKVEYGEGVIVQPSPGIILKGKITIPVEMEYDGKMLPVIAIKGFGGSQEEVSPHEITHIFMEESKITNQLYDITKYAVCNSPSFKYFDFENCNVRFIRERAFWKNDSQDNTSFGKQLLVVESFAFNQSFNLSGRTIMLPSTLYNVGEHSFSYLNIKNCSLEIGTENQLSELDFSNNPPTPFIQNDDNKFTEINFYSSNYDTGELEVESILEAGSDNVSIM